MTSTIACLSFSSNFSTVLGSMLMLTLLVLITTVVDELDPAATGPNEDASIIGKLCRQSALSILPATAPLDGVPPPTHWHSQIEPALARMFHPSNMCLECRRPTVRRSHHGDEIESLSVPPHEDVIAPIERSVPWTFAQPPFEVGN